MSQLTVDPFLREYAETQAYQLGRPTLARPTPDGKSVLFLRAEARSPEQSLYQLDVATGQVRTLVSPSLLVGGAAEHLTPEERALRERQRTRTRGLTSYQMSDDGARLLVPLSGRLFLVERASGAVRELPTGKGAFDARFSPDGARVAYVRDRDLYTLDLSTGSETRLTTAEHPRVTHGLAEFVAQEEMHRFTGYWWSPDGKWLAFERADSRGVETFHIADGAHPEAEPTAVPYPRPGKANVEVRLGVVSATGGEPAWVEWDARALPYLASVEWRAGGPLTIVLQDRLQQRLEVRAVDTTRVPGTLATRTLLAETDDAWIDLDQTVPRWLPGGSGFLWSSDRAGHRRYELRAPDGQLRHALGPDEDAGAPVAHHSLVAVDHDARCAWILASADATQSHLWRAPLDGSAAERLTGDGGVHGASFAPGHAASSTIDRLHVLSRSTRSSLARSVVRREREEIAQLPSVALDPPWRPNVAYEVVGERALHASIVRPRDFSDGKRYPVIVQVYGGPGHLEVVDAMGPLLFRQWIADHGYVVVTVDNRGTPRRDRAFSRAIRGDFAGPTLDDQLDGLAALGARHPELDLSRVGIYGWSFGGYLAALAVLRRPDVFHVGVAGAPVVDWTDYDTHYTERYLGLPDGMPDAYRRSSLLTYASSLARPLLLIHGTGDDNVYFVHTLKLADALFRAGKRFELLPLTNFTHMVADPAVTQALYARILATFGDVLRP